MLRYVTQVRYHLQIFIHCFDSYYILLNLKVYNIRTNISWKPSDFPEVVNRDNQDTDGLWCLFNGKTLVSADTGTTGYGLGRLTSRRPSNINNGPVTNIRKFSQN